MFFFFLSYNFIVKENILEIANKNNYFKITKNSRNAQTFMELLHKFSNYMNKCIMASHLTTQMQCVYYALKTIYSAMRYTYHEWPLCQGHLTQTQLASLNNNNSCVFNSIKQDLIWATLNMIFDASWDFKLMRREQVQKWKPNTAVEFSECTLHQSLKWMGYSSRGSCWTPLLSAKVRIRGGGIPKTRLLMSGKTFSAESWLRLHGSGWCGRNFYHFMWCDKLFTYHKKNLILVEQNKTKKAKWPKRVTLVTLNVVWY